MVVLEEIEGMGKMDIAMSVAVVPVATNVLLALAMAAAMVPMA